MGASCDTGCGAPEHLVSDHKGPRRIPSIPLTSTKPPGPEIPDAKFTTVGGPGGQQVRAISKYDRAARERWQSNLWLDPLTPQTRRPGRGSRRPSPPPPTKPLNLERVSDNAYASSLPPTAQNSALSGRTASAELADDAVTRDLGDAHRVIVSGEPGPGGQAQRATFNESSRQIPCHVPCGGAFSQGNPLLPIAA